ncbi:hypothetical protein CDEST_06020 [Colletotrichum destructivum]|uniref:Uncharacterized protein n=1 Tax=Colletotrichum destructivum TaxID=34406 RepID=A0AAX4ICB7_9PEZI|nr:hypothetical protein CDEST_06020 [Colletotrichum destructivum]
MIQLMSAAAALAAVYSITLSPATVLVSAEPISAAHQYSPVSPPPSSSYSDFAPSPEHARENAVHIFNAVHSAMRQWGSSLHHNGLGLIPATVPRGTLMYHGTRSNSTPEGFEWLAFEMEHSENFARSWRKGRGTPPPKPPGKGKGKPPPPRRPHGGEPIIPMMEGQKPLGGGNDDERPPRGPGGPNEPVRGYFHTYRANRDLKLLYLDGMAAGKTGMGTLDTQDTLLRDLDEAPGFGEYDRAKEICEVVKAWGLDGVIRMEIGFEAIYCDFFDGLDLVSVMRRPWSDQVEGGDGRGLFDWARAVAQRYDGIGGGRVRLGFGGMVNGLWYPLNVSNPNGRRDMPRLGRLAREEREVVLGRIEEIVKGAAWSDGKVDWQGVADLIVTRFGDRIEAIADDEAVVEDEAFLSQVLGVTNTFVDYPWDEFDSVAAVQRGQREEKEEVEEGYVREARGRCVAHYLEPATAWRDEWTREDEMIYVAISAVAERICGDLFDVRGLVLDAAPELAGAVSEADVVAAMAAAATSRRGSEDADADGDAADELAGAVRRGRETIRTLKGDLGWSLWKRCKPGCGVAEICFVAMWPFGLKDDHYRPSCQNRSALEDRGARYGDEERYWEWEPR